MSTTNFWENEAWKQLERVKELEEENALLRHRYSLDPEPSTDLQDTQTSTHIECGRCPHSFDQHDITGCEVCDTCTVSNQRRNRALG